VVGLAAIRRRAVLLGMGDRRRMADHHHMAALHRTVPRGQELPLAVRCSVLASARCWAGRWLRHRPFTRHRPLRHRPTTPTHPRHHRRSITAADQTGISMRSTPYALVGLLLGATLSAPAALAQSPTTPAVQTQRGAQSTPDRVEQRIADLHARLQITPDQQPLWDKFAQVMRDNAGKCVRSPTTGQPGSRR
jgi:hypothetical protein